MQEVAESWPLRAGAAVFTPVAESAHFAPPLLPQRIQPPQDVLPCPALLCLRTHSENISNPAPGSGPGIELVE